MEPKPFSQLDQSPKTQQQLDAELDKLYLATTEQLDMNMESVREKLIAQVGKHPFWSNKAARRMQLEKLESRQIYIYELVSFCERRDLEWRFEPYRGGLISSTPYRHPELAAGAGAGDKSQPGTPLNSPLRLQAGVRVPRSYLLSVKKCEPLASWSVPLASSADQFPAPPPSNSTGDGRVSVRRSPSNANSPTRTAAAAAAAAVAANKSLSAVAERKLPSAEFVWSIEAPASLTPEPFVGQLHSLELPGSSFVKRCHGCQGRGRLKCATCHGVGYEVCISCSGRGSTRNHSAAALGSGSRLNDRASRNSTSASGYDDDGGGASDHRSESRVGRGNEPGGISGGGSSGFGSGAGWSTEACHYCHGAGQKRCWVCAGRSYNLCQFCLGLGQLRCYLNLNITWVNHRDESILNNSDNIIPKERLRLCSGLLLAEKSGARLRPLARPQLDGATGCAEDSSQLHLASRRLLDKHNQTYRHERLIKQRHKVTQIQCHVVKYEWKHRRGHFVIYGDERKVYIAKYPFKSICSIT